MPTPKLEERISTLEKRLQQLKAKQQRAAAKQRAIEVQRDRKAETRRKILVGAIVLERVERGEVDQAQFRRWLNEGLTRPDDRALFDLSSG